MTPYDLIEQVTKEAITIDNNEEDNVERQESKWVLCNQQFVMNLKGYYRKAIF